jgi:hypothetical protein
MVAVKTAAGVSVGQGVKISIVGVGGTGEAVSQG